MYEGVLRIKSINTINIRKLIRTVGGDPKNFLAGASLDGIDLRGQDITGISLESVSIEGVMADTRTLADNEPIKASLLKASISTYRRAISQIGRRDVKLRGKLSVELAAAASYLHEYEAARTALSELDERGMPESLAVLIESRPSGIGYDILRVVTLWLERFGDDYSAFETYMALAQERLNVNWLGRALDWSIRHGSSSRSLKLARSIASGPNGPLFEAEIRERLKSKRNNAKDVGFWLISIDDKFSSELYFNSMRTMLSEGWQKTIPSKTRISMFSKFILSDYGINTAELINSYSDNDKRKDWINALSKSLVAADTWNHFQSITQVAARLDISLPPVRMRGSTLAERKRYVAAALAQLKRLEPNLASRVNFDSEIGHFQEQDFPERSDLYVGTVHVLRQLGGRGTLGQIEEGVVSQLDLSSRVVRLPHRGKRTKLQYELAWVRTYLKWGQALENPARGTWALTKLGEVMSDGELRNLWRRIVSERRAKVAERPALVGRAVR